ncbi:MAG TPA: asparaginase, partial [Glutamicibacter sp.]|nr:asparaginase [Glutamicibacter sp.]
MLPQHVPLVAATRGEAVESIHYGSAVLLDAQGQVLVSLGEPQAAYYPRSALKPLFAVGMLRAGLQLDDQQLALASASHSGAPIHQQVASSTLAAANLDESALRNSTDLPYGVAERADYLAGGGT